MTAEQQKEQALKLAKLRAEVENITSEYIQTLIHSQEAREQHTDFLMTILDSIADGLLVFDCDQKVILANQAAAKIAGMNLSGIDKSSIREKITFYKHQDGDLLPEVEEPFFHALNQKEACEKEGFIKGENISEEGIWLRAHAAPVLNKKNELLGVVSTFSDITERKRLQQQRDALSSVIAHDLKNHLAGEEMILGYLSNLESNLDEKALDAISKMQASNKHHLELATSLLEIFRADFVFSSDSTVDLDLSKIIESVLFLNSLAASVLGVQIKTQVEADLPCIKGVPAAIRHALHNLLQNAINMSAKGDVINVVVEKSAKSTKGVAISVIDQGIGMSEDQVRTLFDRSSVANKLPADCKSSGVGLFFSKLLLDAHQASIECQSTPGKGSKFTIQLSQTV